MTWAYHATDARGRDQHGVLDASSETEARAQLRARQLFLVSLEAVASTRASAAATHPVGGWRQQVAHWSGGATRELAVLTRAMASLLDAGIPLDRALDHLGSTASAGWRAPFRSIQQRVQRGQSLAEALADEASFPRLYAPMIAAAESSGRLAATWASLADHLERTVDTSTRVRAALVYPAILAMASLIGTTILLLVVVPRFATLLADATIPLPLLTRALLAVSAGLRSGGWLVMAAALAALWLAARGSGSRGRPWWHRLPMVDGYLRERDAARYLDTLGLALDSGVPLLRAMALARGTVETPRLVDACAAAEVRVRDGGGVADALGGLLPPLARPLLSAGESGGALAAMAQRAAAVAESRARERLEGAVRLLEPLLILAFGGVVGGVALGLLQAVYQLNAVAL
jgi:type II secretory pathway component PulF